MVYHGLPIKHGDFPWLYQGIRGMWRAKKLEMNWDENRGPSSGTDRKWNDRPATQGIPFPAQETPMIDSNVGKITIQIYPDISRWNMGTTSP